MSPRIISRKSLGLRVEFAATSFTRVKVKSYILLAYALCTHGFTREVAHAQGAVFSHASASLSELSDRHTLLLLGVGSALTLAALTVDHQVAAYFDGGHGWGGWGDLGNKFLGTGVPGAAIGLSTLIYGYYSKNESAQRSGSAQLEALLTTGLLTGALKVAVHRERPDRSDHYSFPSGHSSTVFASAAVLHEMYGSTWLSLLAYSLAAYTAAARVVDQKHHVSDVIFGATLGMVIGRSFALGHQEPAKLLWLPYYDNRKSFGLRLALTY